jgi:hypothetical protein
VTLPTSVLDVLAFVKDGVNPGLFDRQSLQFPPLFRVRPRSWLAPRLTDRSRHHCSATHPQVETSFTALFSR